MIPEIETLYKIKDEVYATIRKIQDECEHPPETLKGIYMGDTGNYDPHDDRYWITFTCELCDKTWQANHGTPEYRRPHKKTK